MRATIFIALLLFAAAVRTEGAGIVSQRTFVSQSNFGDKWFESRVPEERLMNTPVWKADADSPPLPARASTTNNAPAPAAIPTMDINQARMVTVELDFGLPVPTIAQALREVERRYQPDDGTGRTFAIIEAYGEPTPDGKLHMSMHVSSEKPGLATLRFRRTGEVLWQSRIVATNKAARPFSGKDLSIYIDNGQGKGMDFTVDGSSNPASILDASIKEMSVPVRIFWPEGAERQVTFNYSACGCPVKVMVRRDGERTARTKDLPVMFPDDPSVVALISKLMQWQ